MNIYIPIEIKIRELESRLLLALEAASRGHDVILGDKASTINAAVKGKLKPGIVHDKSIQPASIKIDRYLQLLKDGFVITSQDEEGGIVHRNIDNFISRRFASETLQMIHRNYNWGQFEYDTILNLFPKHKEKLLNTGSPRVDLWKSQFDQFFKNEYQPGHNFRKKYGKYLLISSNFGTVLNVNRLWVLLDIKRRHDAGFREEDEEAYYGRIADQTKLLYKFIEMVRRLARELPGTNVVVRPHPAEDEDAWPRLIGEGYPNIHVIREGSINSWIKNSEAVIHNNCTTGFEAAAVGKPVITYLPDEEGYIVNDCSIKAHTLEQLVGLTREITSGNRDVSNIDESYDQNYVNDILQSRLTNLFGENYAYKAIVDDWETFDSRHLSHKNDLFSRKEKPSTGGSIIERIKNKVKKTNSFPGQAISQGFSKSQGVKGFNNKHKFKDITEDEMSIMLDGFSEINPVFKEVNLQWMNKRSLFLSKK